MNTQLRKWIGLFDGSFQEEKLPVKETADVGCDCRLYSCGICFPENYSIQTESGYTPKFTLGDYVQITANAGGGFGKVIEVLGEMLRVDRASDNVHILIHESDVITSDLETTDDELEFEFDDETDDPEIEFPSDEIETGDLPMSAGSDDVSELIADIGAWRDMELPGTRPFTDAVLDKCTPDAIKRLHARLSISLNESVLEDQEVKLFDLYCDLCMKKHGRVKGRSRFLNMSPEEQQEEINKLKQ